MNTQQPRFSRRTIAVSVLLIVAIVIGTLIALDQIAVLYLLATVTLVGLLLVVAFADLESVGVDGDGGFSRDLR